MRKMRQKVSGVTKAERRWMKLMELGRHLGCHQMPERSFFYHGYQFPVCARCTGVLLSSLPSLWCFLRHPLRLWQAAGLCAVMGVDWLIQRLGICPSTNKRRLWTGFLGGFGLWQIHLAGDRALWRWLTKKGKHR